MVLVRFRVKVRVKVSVRASPNTHSNPNPNTHSNPSPDLAVGTELEGEVDGGLAAPARSGGVCDVA